MRGSGVGLRGERLPPPPPLPQFVLLHANIQRSVVALVCVCVRAEATPNPGFHAGMRVIVRARVMEVSSHGSTLVCVCVCERERERDSVCVKVCVKVRERERERERESVRVCAIVCAKEVSLQGCTVCVCARVCVCMITPPLGSAPRRTRLSLP